VSVRAHSLPDVARGRTGATALLCALTITGCDVNPFDASQQPVVAVSSAGAEAPVRISWQPAGAQFVRVHAGAAIGTAAATPLVWSVVATGTNSLASGLAYGDTAPVGGSTDLPARPLTAGATYTVQVTRQDPRGSGDGFTNTNNRYVGTAVFTAP